jgi:hypothetical protein
MYGILLAMKEKYSDAEIFLKSVTRLYPRFAEGWAILHLLYVKIDYFPGNNHNQTSGLFILL